MPDLVLLQSAIGSLKAAADLALGLNKLNSLAEVQGKAIELQQMILTAQAGALNAQSEQFAMIERVRELEREIAEIRAWGTVKQRYRLHEPAPGIFVHSLRADAEPPEPAHWICAKCYEDGRRSIVQTKNAGRAMHYYICFHCKSEFHIATGWEPPSRGEAESDPGSWMR